jgi:hypothetical protein
MNTIDKLITTIFPSGSELQYSYSIVQSNLNNTIKKIHQSFTNKTSMQAHTILPSASLSP